MILTEYVIFQPNLDRIIRLNQIIYIYMFIFVHKCNQVVQLKCDKCDLMGKPEILGENHHNKHQHHLLQGGKLL